MADTQAPPHGLLWRAETNQWVVTTHEVADTVLRDPHIGTALDPDRAAVPTPGADDVPTVSQFFELWYRRGANHPTFKHRLRAAYSAAAVAAFAPAFEARARELAEALPAEGDLVADFIAPFALDSTFRFMGFPARHQANLAKSYRVLMFVIKQRFLGVLDLPQRQRAAFGSVLAFLRDATAEALAAPDPTPLAAAFLAQAEADGEIPWADVATVGQLLAAGVPQVETGIAVAAHALLTRPEAVGADLAGVAEEAMRLAPPFLGIFGWVTEPCDCLGVRLEPRTAIVVDIPAVNADPAKVADPAAFCPGRSRAENITFGKGAHYCLGAASARAQVVAALRGLLAARPDLDLGALQRADDGFAQSITALHYR
uniref:NocT n=1 Tax=Nocardia sp. ATCC 202099 TaxID=930400 RepID=E5DUH1_9NOCA|nr:NocT [Nocardia sp. ATCC 202099]